MKFMHPAGARLALTSGHVKVLPKGEWVELDPMFHQQAIEKGCHMDSRVGVIADREPPPLTRGPGAQTVHDEREQVRRAIEVMLNRNEEGDFTGSNTPNANVVASITKTRPNKQLVNEVWAEMREIAQQEKEEAERAERVRKAREAADAGGDEGNSDAGGGDAGGQQ